MISTSSSDNKKAQIESLQEIKIKSEKKKEILDPELYYIDQTLIQNVLEHFLEVMHQLEIAQEMEQNYKKEVDILRHDVNKLRHNILNENDETKNRVIPLLETLRRNFISQMSIDKEKQEILQEEIIKLKKEKYLIEDNIIWCLSKITILEDQVGYYKKLRKERLSEEFEKKQFLNKLI